VHNWIKARSLAWRGCALDQAACDTAPEREWREVIASVRWLPREQQLAALNRALNRVPYVDDAMRDGLADYWATPDEFLLRSGDCEDFAIAKYVALRHLGFGAETLRIVVLTDSIRGQVHAVLAVGGPNGTTILDSLTSELFFDVQYAHYVPHISVNELGLWEHFGRNVVPPLAELPRRPLG
jgi:predicted transglutaminase-like cysteine proteinase